MVVILVDRLVVMKVRSHREIANIQKMVDLAIQNGARPYVVLGYEPVGYMDYRKMPTTRYVTRKEDYIPLIARYKTLQQMMASEIKRATIIPKIVLGSSYTSDGTHPTAAGQRIIADPIKRYLSHCYFKKQNFFWERS